MTTQARYELKNADQNKPIQWGRQAPKDWHKQKDGQGHTESARQGGQKAGGAEHPLGCKGDSTQ